MTQFSPRTSEQTTDANFHTLLQRMIHLLATVLKTIFLKEQPTHSTSHTFTSNVCCSFKTEFGCVRNSSSSVQVHAVILIQRGGEMSCSWRASVKSSQSQVSRTTVWNMHWVSPCSLYSHWLQKAKPHYQMTCSSAYYNYFRYAFSHGQVHS